MLDGRVARSRQKHSAMGRELDSLADVISFGVAPAAIAYGAGMSGLWDIVILVYFVCCGVSRLARFNVTAEEMSAAAGKVTYFEGTPIPSSLVLVAVVGVSTWLGRVGDALPLGSVALGPERLAADRENLRRLWDAVTELPDSLRITLLLVVFEELNYEEIGHALGCSEGTVAWRVFRAREILRENLRDVLRNADER